VPPGFWNGTADADAPSSPEVVRLIPPRTPRRPSLLSLALRGGDAAGSMSRWAALTEANLSARLAPFVLPSRAAAAPSFGRQAAAAATHEQEQEQEQQEQQEQEEQEQQQQRRQQRRRRRRQQQRLILLAAPGRGALQAQPLLQDAGRFSAAARRLSGPDQMGAARGLGASWYRCLQMVRNNKCASVC